MTANVRPLPQSYLSIPARLRPMPGPIFPDGAPTPEDIELARELFRELDAESRSWYKAGTELFDGIEPAAVLAKPRKRKRE